MSKNKKFNYSTSPMTNGVLSGFSTGLGFESAKLLLPNLLNLPNHNKNDLCSFEINQINQCMKNNNNNCEELIKLFAQCIEHNK